MKSNLLKFIGLLSLGLALSCESITDIYPPELSLLSPTEEILSADSATFLVSASDNIAIDRVEFVLRDNYTGWSYLETIQAEPYEITIDSVQSLLEIEAEITGFDPAGNFHRLYKTFEIATAVENAIITVVDPNGGESWNIGSTQAVTWTSEFVTDNVEIELYRSNDFVSTIVNSTGNDGNYNWDIPTSLTVAANYKVKIIAKDNSTIYDMSDASFAIVQIECGEGEVVDCNGNCGPQSWLGDGYCDDETYVYEGNYIDFNCEEHDYDAGDCSGGGTNCDPVSSSTGTGSVTSPANGVIVNSGSSATVNWSFTGPGQVNLYLYEENNYHSIIQTWAINDGTFPWVIPSSVESGHCYHIVVINPYDDTDFVVGTYFRVQ